MFYISTNQGILKKYDISTKNNNNNERKISSTTVFNIDNNKKCFLSTKSAY